MSEEARATASASQKARWAALSPEQQEAQRARLRRGGPPKAPADPPPADGGPRSPLDDTLGAREEPARQVAPGRNGHDRASGPPIFRVPDLPPLEVGGGPLPGGPEPLDGPELEGPAGIQVTQEQVATLLRFPFDLASLRRGPHWKLRDDETAMIAEPLTRKINENAIAARALAAGGDWAVIAGGLTVVISARVAEDHRRDRERAAAGARDVTGSGRVPDQDARGRGGQPGRPDAGRSGPSLNGIVLAPGTVDDAGDAALDPEAPGHPLVQAL
jgi:hypothetical protein